MTDDRVHTVEPIYPGMYVLWMLGNTCSYQCSYCSSIFHDGSFPYHDHRFVIEGLRKLPKAHVMLSGGEPTFHPHIEWILVNKPDHIRLSLLSNAARPISFWQRIERLLFTVIFSFHIEYARVNRFIATAGLFHDKRKLQYINLPMVPDKWDLCVEAYQAMTAQGLPVSPKPVIENFGFSATQVSSKYTQEQLDWLKSKAPSAVRATVRLKDAEGNVIKDTTPSDLLAAKDTDFRGWLCHTPTQFLNVDFNGNVYDTACGQRRFLGTITEGFTPRGPVTCRQEFCWCHSDILPLKERAQSSGDQRVIAIRRA